VGSFTSIRREIRVVDEPGPLLDHTALQQILPHRFPFLFIDRVIELEPNRRILAIKRVSGNEQYLARRPGEPPVLPPTILMEAVAQAGAILVLSSQARQKEPIYFAGIERARCRRPVYAGDTLMIEAILRRRLGGVGRLSGTARVNGRLVASGSIRFALPGA